MKFLEEKETKQCFVFMSIVGCLFVAFILILNFRQAEITRKLMAEQETTMISSLIDQGVSKETIATAAKSKQQTKAGKELIAQMGLIPNTVSGKLVIDLPILHKIVPVSMSGAIFLVLIMLVGLSWHLRQRDRLYLSIAKQIEDYSNGNFGKHLPRNYTGSLYQLLSIVDELAMALKAKEETQQKAKEFLKNMISDISHQLKTPLAALSMYNEIMEQEPENQDTLLTFIGKSQKALSRMEQLIQSLLKTTRLDAKSIQFEKQSIRVADLVDRAIQDLRQRAVKENKVIQYVGKNEVLDCDLQWTSEALGNLVKNALDHTRESGCIQISTRHTPGMIQISVSDDGCGIEKEELPFIFKRFYRSKTSTDQQGVGLGLPMAKAIVEEQNGILTVESNIGEGTVFTMSFLTDS